MKIIKKLKKYILDKDYRFLVNSTKFNHFPRMSDEKYITRKFKAKTGSRLNLDNPISFNEKLQWIKLYDRNPLYTTLVDKYLVKAYVADAIGNQYIIPTIGVWDDVNDIDFNILPKQFVLKCTHDSHGLVICNDKTKLDEKAAIKKLKEAMNKNYYLLNREWPYRDVKPRIIAEKYMIDDEVGELRDYKFFCFNGVCKTFKIDFDRFTEHRANYYDTDGNLLPFGEEVCLPNPEKEISMPKNLSDMIRIAEKLSKDIPFVRVDLYNVNSQVYFGEMTFFPASGFGLFVPVEWDVILGNWMELPKR